MNKAPGPDFRARQGFELQFQANGEQQQHDTHVGDGFKVFSTSNPKGLEHKSCYQIPDQRRQSGAVNRKTKDKGDQD
jgi:hypothetical protein